MGLPIIALSACSDSQLRTARTTIDVTEKTCEVILTATDPGLAPLCTTAAEVAQVVTDLIEAHNKTALAEAADAGIKPSIAPYHPTRDEVYASVAARGAATTNR